VRTVRVECLDWILIVSRRHLDRVLSAYLQHYNTGRPHRGLGLAVPEPAPARAEEPDPVRRRIERVDVLGGLIHEDRHAA